MALTVHGDDFTVSGTEEDITWLVSTLKAKYDLKVDILGPDSHQKQEIQILKRTLRWTEHGIEYEADERHSALVIKELELEGAKPVSTPYGPEEHKPLENMEVTPLDTKEASRYRAIVARLNYLAQDRPDLQYAVKEACKRMSAPTAQDWPALRRIGRYLVGAPRAVQLMAWQEEPGHITVFADSDWAGDKTSAKSTSGGMVFRGRHLLKSWSSTQQVIALSSGEAELYALTKGAAQALGAISMGQDLGETLNATVKTDSSAALGIVQRSGLGKVRHLNVQYLWLQERVYNKDLWVEKVHGPENPADLLTKGLAQELLNKCVKMADIQIKRQEG